MNIERDPTMAVSESLGVHPTHDDFVRARREFHGDAAAIEFLDDVEKIHSGLVDEQPLAINWDDFAAKIESRLDSDVGHDDKSVLVAPTFDDETNAPSQEAAPNASAPQLIPFKKSQPPAEAKWREYSAWLSVAAVVALGIAVTRNTSFGPQSPDIANQQIGQVAETAESPVARARPAAAAPAEPRAEQPSPADSIGSRVGESALARTRGGRPSEAPASTYQTREWNPPFDQQQMPSNAAIPAAVPQSPELEAAGQAAPSGDFAAGARAVAPASSSGRFAAEAQASTAQRSEGRAQEQAATRTAPTSLLSRENIETLMNRCFGTTSVSLPTLSLVVQGSVVRSLGIAGATQEQESCLRSALQNARVALTDGPHRLTQRAQERSRRPSMRRAQDDAFRAAEAF